MKKPHTGVAKSFEQRDSTISVPHSLNMSVSPNKHAFGFPHQHFAIIYLGHHGKLHLKASPSVAGSEGAIFTPDVTGRFMEMVALNTQPQVQFPINKETTELAKAFAVSVQACWTEKIQSTRRMQPDQTRAAEMIPCEWHSQKPPQKRRGIKRTVVRNRPRAASSGPQLPLGGSALRIGDQEFVRLYYEKAFEDLQQLNCRTIAKSWIRLVEPRKQIHFPYNGRKVIAGVSQRIDPELTKPGCWPAGVVHREPDYLLKPDRVRLLVHILCELRQSHGVTAEKLRAADQDVRCQIRPANRLRVLDEVYFVRKIEEQYLKREIEDVNTLVQVTQSRLPQTLDQDKGHGRNLGNRVCFTPMTSFVAGHGEHSPGGDEGFPIHRDGPVMPSSYPALALPSLSRELDGPDHRTSARYGAYHMGHALPTIFQEPSDSSASMSAASDPVFCYSTQPFGTTEDSCISHLSLSAAHPAELHTPTKS
ncbi:hypothetical protein N7451_012007, partial [Penicillium sp. IBT 35674x]